MYFEDKVFLPVNIGYLTCANWHHGWLNEGFATYSEALWHEHKNGTNAYHNNMSSNQYFQGGTLYLQNADDTINIFQSIIYSKGAYALHMLRAVVGNDMFFEGLLEYSQHPDYMYKVADTEDLQEVYEDVSGMDLNFFFDQWIYDEYFPVYQYNHAQNSNNTFYLTIYQAQEEYFNRRPVFEMPVQLLFHFQDNSDSLITVWNNEQTQGFSFDFDLEVTSMQFDPDKWILRHAEFNSGIPVGDVELRKEDFNFYPNPCQDKILLNSKNDYKEISIEILNSAGKVCLLSKFKKSRNIEINVSSLPSGVYFAKIKANEQLNVIKFVKTEN